MEIKYEIHKMKNRAGGGKDRKFVVLRNQPPLTLDEMASVIEERCTLTEPDVLAVLKAFRNIAVEQLQQGRRFHIPGIGWLSLSACLDNDAKNVDRKVTGRNVRVKSINFKVENKFFNDATEDISFVKSDYSTQSKDYTEDAIWAKLNAYLKHNDFIDRRIVEQEFELTKYSAYKWLNYFTEKGKLKRKKYGQSFIYRLKKGK